MVKFLKNAGRMSERIPSRILRKNAGGIVEEFPDKIPKVILSEKFGEISVRFRRRNMKGTPGEIRGDIVGRIAQASSLKKL